MALFRSLVCFLCLLTLFIGLTSCGKDPEAGLLVATRDRGFFRVGVKYDSPPFGFLDEHGNLNGLEVMLANRLASDILDNGGEVKFVQVNSATRVAALNAKQVDFVIATMSITPQREKVVSFSKPYFHTSQRVLVKSKSPYRRLTDLKDKTVLYVIGTTGEANLAKLLPKAHRLGFRSTLEAFTAFQAGRGDAFTTDEVLLNNFIHHYCGIRLLPEKLSKETYGIAFRKDEGSKMLIEQVNNELTSILGKSHDLRDIEFHWLSSEPPAKCKGS